MAEIKRILHVLGGLDRGGAETLVMNIYNNIDREKFQFDFVIHTDNHGAYYDQIIKMGGKIYTCPKYKIINHFEYVKWWKKFLMEHSEYRVIHGHVRSTASIYLKIARKFSRFTIAHSHSTSSGKGIGAIVKNIMQHSIRYNSDYFMGCSYKANKWLFGKKVADNTQRCLVLKNGIDLKKFCYNENVQNDYKEKLNIKGKLVVGTVGRIEVPKNPLFIVDVFERVLRKKSDSVLLWVGDGSMKSEVIEKIKELGIENKVLLVGSQDNVADYMQAMDVFLFPSLWEGLGMSLIEAQALGIPSVVSDAIPQEALITNLVNVIKLSEDVEVWADTCMSMAKISKNNNSLESVRCSGYDIKQVVKIIGEVYDC